MIKSRLTLNTGLGMVAVALAGTLAFQIADRVVHRHSPTTKTYFASWTADPKNMTDLNRLADTIVTGRVVNIQRGKDIVTKMPGEPGGVDRIPTEIVTFQVEEALKGKPGRQIQVFRTGLSADAEALVKQRPPRKPPGPRPKNAVGNPQKLPRPSLRQANRYSIHNDVAYKRNERYMLFLTKGPQFARGAKRPVAPTGKFKLTRDNKLVPLIDRAVASKLKGMRLTSLRNQLKQLQINPGLKQPLDPRMRQPGRLKIDPKLDPRMQKNRRFDPRVRPRGE